MRKCDETNDHAQISEMIVVSILASFGLFVMAITIPTVMPFAIAKMPAEVQTLSMWAVGAGFCLSIFGLIYTQISSSSEIKKEDVDPNFKAAVSKAQNSALTKKGKRYNAKRYSLEDLK